MISISTQNTDREANKSVVTFVQSLLAPTLSLINTAPTPVVTARRANMKTDSPRPPQRNTQSIITNMHIVSHTYAIASLSLPRCTCAMISSIPFTPSSRFRYACAVCVLALFVYLMSISRHHLNIELSEPISVCIRAHAFITLGKLCLRDVNLAKRCMTVFVRELEAGTDAVITNNVLVIMSDLCRTFSTVVDHYIPALSSCIRHTNAIVRRHTLMIMSSLLQEDYLKWKSSMFFRFLAALADPTQQIRKFGIIPYHIIS